LLNSLSWSILRGRRRGQCGERRRKKGREDESVGNALQNKWQMRRRKKGREDDSV
jgi:hypothetical protein